METSFTPLRLFDDNFFKELKREGVLLLSTLPLEVQMGGSEVNLLVEDVHEMEFDEDSIFPLGPFDSGVPTYKGKYSIGVVGY